MKKGLLILGSILWAVGLVWALTLGVGGTLCFGVAEYGKRVMPIYSTGLNQGQPPCDGDNSADLREGEAFFEQGKPQ